MSIDHKMLHYVHLADFDFHWGEAGTTDDPCRNTYPGPFPFSEPEANNTANYLFNNRNRIRAYLTFHSYSQVHKSSSNQIMSRRTYDVPLNITADNFESMKINIF